VPAQTDEVLGGMHIQNSSVTSNNLVLTLLSTATYWGLRSCQFSLSA
jgi:hypothetical protein